ncbi:hypothetical protein Ciccas_006432 [Cichlidogyrus casuarinus]|uniref:Uncharacterized protein n=1 Tax=Cichlidogyrus casuarinus TaxID=1844966 RepID=A0ABD2Q6X1_9PLAT
MSERETELLAAISRRNDSELIPKEIFFANYEKLLYAHIALKKKYAKLRSCYSGAGDCSKELELMQRLRKAEIKLHDAERQNQELSPRIDTLTENLEKAKTANVMYEERISMLEANNRILKEENSSSSHTIKAYEKQLRKEKEEEMKKQRKLESQMKVRQPKKEQTKCQELFEVAKHIVDVREIKIHSNDSSRLPMRHIGTIPNEYGDTYHVAFQRSGQIFGCAGTDRKIHLWNFNGLNYEYRSTLNGSNKSVTSLDFHSEGKLVLGSSNDASCRIWSICDSRLKITFSGHNNSVVSAKFISDFDQVASISADHSIKGKRCLTSKGTSSVGHEIVYNRGRSQLITGHRDKKIRFWDLKGQNNDGCVSMPDRITGLDLFDDANHLLVSTRDNVLRTLDLRMCNKELECYQHDNFRIASDYARPSFSSDGRYLACGSQDQMVYVWRHDCPEPVSILEGHNSPVIACSWQPTFGNALVTCERHKQVIVWGS